MDANGARPLYASTVTIAKTFGAQIMDQEPCNSTMLLCAKCNRFASARCIATRTRIVATRISYVAGPTSTRNGFYPYGNRVVALRVRIPTGQDRHLRERCRG
eukprot:scaffold57243_cov17-Prasinocladus_malaysianus.AAC.1